MRRRTPHDPRALVARFGWRQRAWPSLVLAAAALALGLSLLLDRSYSFWNDAGTLAMTVLFAVFLVGWARPAWRRDVAVAIEKPGITVGGMGIVHGRQRHIPWSQVAGVRVYVLSWEATGSSPPTGGSNPVFHVDLTDGGAVRTYTTGARLDHARVAPAVRQFGPQVPVTDLGYVCEGDDPLRGPGDLVTMTEALFSWVDRLRARRGQPPLRRLSPRDGPSPPPTRPGRPNN
jgi:Bacterial PH domain